ncbi:MAG: DUF1688 family protein [Dinoroseobacter sp.]|nr:DUF1688 family protein [Dinoroseobacter sp.]
MTTEAEWLLSPGAIRRQCGALFDLGLAGELEHFTVHLDRMPACAGEVVKTIRSNYPDLNVPPHARWRHFVISGKNHWASHSLVYASDPRERVRVECELAILSVLLDAGAGAAWSYRDPATGTRYARSEGLALASLNMFVGGSFDPCTATALRSFNEAQLAEGFQVSDENPLEGLAGRAALITALGEIVASRPDVFGANGRLGGIADFLIDLAAPGLEAEQILITLLDVLGPIWPGTPQLEGRSLGDCWPHPQAPGSGFVPFHKLSQWLSYSLLEPLERAGVAVTGLDALTGLAEYRNGGLFLDSGVLELKVADPGPVPPQNPLVVEWRALTIALLDRVAEVVRAELGKSASEMPLASVLEGGTWATGRRLAQASRRGGTPPIEIVSTGTVF